MASGNRDATVKAKALAERRRGKVSQRDRDRVENERRAAVAQRSGSKRLSGKAGDELPGKNVILVSGIGSRGLTAKQQSSRQPSTSHAYVRLAKGLSPAGSALLASALHGGRSSALASSGSRSTLSTRLASSMLVAQSCTDPVSRNSTNTITPTATKQSTSLLNCSVSQKITGKIAATVTFSHPGQITVAAGMMSASRQRGTETVPEGARSEQETARRTIPTEDGPAKRFKKEVTGVAVQASATARQAIKCHTAPLDRQSRPWPTATVEAFDLLANRTRGSFWRPYTSVLGFPWTPGARLNRIHGIQDDGTWILAATPWHRRAGNIHRLTMLYECDLTITIKGKQVEARRLLTGTALPDTATMAEACSLETWRFPDHGWSLQRTREAFYLTTAEIASLTLLPSSVRDLAPKNASIESNQLYFVVNATTSVERSARRSSLFEPCGNTCLLVADALVAVDIRLLALHLGEWFKADFGPKTGIMDNLGAPLSREVPLAFLESIMTEAQHDSSAHGVNKVLGTTGDTLFDRVQGYSQARLMIERLLHAAHPHNPVADVLRPHASRKAWSAQWR